MKENRTLSVWTSASFSSWAFVPGVGGLWVKSICSSDGAGVALLVMIDSDSTRRKIDIKDSSGHAVIIQFVSMQIEQNQHYRKLFPRVSCQVDIANWWICWQTRKGAGLVKDS